MLKRIKETLTCNSSGGKSRTTHKLKSHHLLHSDKIDNNTYFYNKSKVATLFGFASRSTNDIRWTSQNRIPFGAVISTRSSRETTSYSGIGSQTLSSHISYRKMAGRANRLGNSRFSTIPLVLSAFGLLLVLGMMISPSISTGERVFGGDKAYAEEGASNEPVPYTVPPDDGVSLTINTPLPDDEVIEKQVSGSGAKYITVDFTVGAHNVDDYKVYVQADSATLTGKSYSDTITTINAPTTATEMNSATKKWGYAVAEGQNVSTDSMTFNTIQTSVSTPAASVTGENGAKILNHAQPYTLAFAANLDGAKADHYKSNITLSVAANAQETAQLGFGATVPGVGTYRIETMQQMTSGFCGLMPEGTEGQLQDTRDDKIYWVVKLRDGNCWMAQNLDYDIKMGVTLTSMDSDVQSDWTPANNEATMAPSTILSSSTWPSGSQYYNMVKSYDPGKYLSTAPVINNSSNQCGGDNFSLCASKGWTNVSDTAKFSASSNPNFYIDNTHKTIVDNIYDAHFLIGNYYSWGAATAGQASSMTASAPVESMSSICPRGWRLPASLNGDFSYSNLIATYGSNQSGTANIGGHDARLRPFYFVMGGRVLGNKLEQVGVNGYYWPSTSYTTGHSYYFIVGYNSITNGYTTTRDPGATLRCVAR